MESSSAWVSLSGIVHHIYTSSLIYTFSEWSWFPRVPIDINLAIFNNRCCGQLRGSGFVPVANQLRQLPRALQKLAGVSLNIYGSDRSLVAYSARCSVWTRIANIHEISFSAEKPLVTGVSSPTKCQWCVALVLSLMLIFDKLFNKQPCCQLFDTPWHSCDVIVMCLCWTSIFDQ